MKAPRMACPLSSPTWWTRAIYVGQRSTPHLKSKEFTVGLTEILKLMKLFQSVACH